MASNKYDGCASCSGCFDDESISSFFADESETYGEQSLVGFNTIRRTSDNEERNKQLNPGPTSKPYSKSHWQGSCASFFGSSTELLHLSASHHDLDESVTFLALHNSTVLKKLLQANSNQLGKNLNKRDGFGINFGKEHGLFPSDDRHQLMPLSQSLHIAPTWQNKSSNDTVDTISKETRDFFNSVSSDLLPKKPAREREHTNQNTCIDVELFQETNFLLEQSLSDIFECLSPTSSLEESSTITDERDSLPSITVENSIVSKESFHVERLTKSGASSTCDDDDKSRSTSKRLSMDCCLLYESTHKSTQDISEARSMLRARSLSVSNVDEAPRRPRRGLSPRNTHRSFK